jgi:hypothetical protein
MRTGSPLRRARGVRAVAVDAGSDVAPDGLGLEAAVHDDLGRRTLWQGKPRSVGVEARLRPRSVSTPTDRNSRPPSRVADGALNARLYYCHMISSYDCRYRLRADGAALSASAPGRRRPALPRKPQVRHTPRSCTAPPRRSQP